MPSVAVAIALSTSHDPELEQTADTKKMTDILDTMDVLVIGMLGGPGSGKGTQCRLLADAFNLRHLSVGDVLRTEMNREGSPFVEEIRNNMLAGRVGPKEITVGVLRHHIACAMQEGIRTFVLDGKLSVDSCLERH
jgi:UMP-CMP kinase